jgi:hypothetical protein
MAVYKYSEFKKASKKHLVTCECLIESLENDCKQKEKHILTTIYYLTGYVFETILKFSLYASVSFDKNEDISKLNSHGLTFDNNIKIHSLIKLKRVIEAKNITSLYQYKNNKNLFSAWNSEIRYNEKINFSKKEILSFFEFSKATYTTLQQYK